MDQFRVKIRQFTWDDIYPLVAMLNTANQVDRESTRYTVDSLHHLFSTPTYKPERDGFVAVTPTQRILAYADTWLDTRTGKAWGMGAVHPDYRRRGLGNWLLQVADFQLINRYKEVQNGQPLISQQQTWDKDNGGRALLNNSSYNVAQYMYRMRMDLHDDLPDVDLPEGFSFQPFERERDAKRFYKVHQESFRNYWGHEVDTPYNIWEHEHLETNFDPSLWVMLKEDSSDEIVGVVINKAYNYNPEKPRITGYIGVLGVRENWRGKGLGLALLKHSFQILYKAGFSRALLSVNANDPNDSLKVYKKVGMEIYRRYVTYHKILREALSKTESESGKKST